MKALYLIPGLGADRRVFKFLDLSQYSCHHISWIDPLPDESIEHYAGRLVAQIKSTNPILVGVSFGGMIAVEISKQISIEKVILISSARTGRDIPVYLRLFGRLSIHKVLPARWLKKANHVLYYFFDVKMAEEKRLLSEIIRDTDQKFMKWAIDKIVRWKNNIIPSSAILIHGSADRLFPASKADIIIPDGGHFMIVSNAKEVSEHIKRIIYPSSEVGATEESPC